MVIGDAVLRHFHVEDRHAQVQAVEQEESLAEGSRRFGLGGARTKPDEDDEPENIS